jgi:hypothetical protein
VSVVWIDMLSSDNSGAAKRAAQSIDDGRVQHFHDPERRVGQALAHCLAGPDPIAWDIYLFYSAGSEWDKSMPQPIAWAHQLSGSWVDHYHYGDALERALHKMAGDLL